MARQLRTSKGVPSATGLFDWADAGLKVQPVDLFQPQRIILTKGWDRTPRQAELADAICAAYPDADVLCRTDLSHSQVDLGCEGHLERHSTGKQTLVLGEHKSPVRFSNEQANCCPNYWHFSPYGFCPYGCTYCYLAGTRGVWFSPTVKVFLNLDQMLDQIDRSAKQIARPVSFYLGKLQDGLALDPITGYCRKLVPFFADHPYARLIVLTKCAQVGNLAGLKPNGRTILSWSLSPVEIWNRYEPKTPSPMERMVAMRDCSDAGYRLRAVIMPILPVGQWRKAYAALLDGLLTMKPLERITLGSMCSFPNAVRLMDEKLGRGDELGRQLAAGIRSADGRLRFPREIRLACYQFMLDRIRQARPDLTVGLCLEEREVFHRLGMESHIGQCNCVL